MQQNDCWTIDRAGLGISDIENTGIDLLQRDESGVRAGPDRRQIRRACPAGLRKDGTAEDKRGGGHAYRGVVQEAATILVDGFRHVDLRDLRLSSATEHCSLPLSS